MSINDNTKKFAAIGAFTGVLYAIYRKKSGTQLLMYSIGLAVVGAVVSNVVSQKMSA